MGRCCVHMGTRLIREVLRVNLYKGREAIVENNQIVVMEREVKVGTSERAKNCNLNLFGQSSQSLCRKSGLVG